MFPKKIERRFYKLINGIEDQVFKRCVILLDNDDEHLVPLFLQLFYDNYEKKQHKLLDKRVDGKKSLLVIQKKIEDSKTLMSDLIKIQKDGSIEFISTKDLQGITDRLNVENPHEALVQFIKQKDYAYILFMPASVTIVKDNEYYQSPEHIKAFENLIESLMELGNEIPVFLLVEKTVLFNSIEGQKGKDLPCFVKSSLLKKIATKGKMV